MSGFHRRTSTSDFVNKSSAVKTSTPIIARTHQPGTNYNNNNNNSQSSSSANNNRGSAPVNQFSIFAKKSNARCFYPIGEIWFIGPFFAIITSLRLRGQNVCDWRATCIALLLPRFIALLIYLWTVFNNALITFWLTGAEETQLTNCGKRKSNGNVGSNGFHRALLGDGSNYNQVLESAVETGISNVQLNFDKTWSWV